MAYSLRLNAVRLCLLLVVSVCVKQHACQSSSQCTFSDECSTFRVFYGDDQRHLDTLSHTELTHFAAKSRENHVVGITRSSQTGISQEEATLNLYCSPCLSSEPPGSARCTWYYVQLDELGNIQDLTMPPQILRPSEFGRRIIIGGDNNEWLNISSVVAGGKEDPDSKIFMCEVCTNQSAPLQQCYTSNFTLRVIGVHPVISNPPTSKNLIQLSRTDLLTLKLNCDVSYATPPRPFPLPTRSWFRNGELVYTVDIGAEIDNNNFTRKHLILLPNLVEPTVFVTKTNGIIQFNTEVSEIKIPIFGLTSTEVARDQLYDVIFGNWTCVVRNDLGSSSIEYIVTEKCGLCTTSHPPDIMTMGAVFPGPEVGWLRDSFTGREMEEMYNLSVGVISGAEFLQDNFTFMVDFCQERDNNTDLTVHTPFVHLSPPFTTQEVSVTFNNDGVAFEGNETYQLCLIPTSSHNQTDVNFRDNITLTILDSDELNLQFLKNVHFISESVGSLTVSLIKDKTIANRLPLFVNTATLAERSIVQCSHLSKPDVSCAKPNEDFTASYKSYFSKDFVYFEADEGRTPVNELNLTIGIINDAVFEGMEGFSIVVEQPTVCETQPVYTDIYIFANDGCPADTVNLPVIGNVSFPISKPGEYAELFPCPGIPNLYVKRFCGVDEQWLDPDYQQCSEAIIGQTLSLLSDLSNITSLDVAAAERLTGALAQLILGAPQTADTLDVIDQTLGVVGKFADEAVSEKVVDNVLNVVDGLSSWSESVLHERSSNIVMSFEAIATNLTEITNFTSQNFTGEKVIFQAETRDVKELIQNGTSVKFMNTKEGIGPDSTPQLCSEISLPPSLFKAAKVNSSADNVGLIFASYSSDIFFPLDLNASDNSSTFIGSSVLGVTVVSDQPVQNLTEPVVIKFKVDNLKNALTVECVSWDFGAAGGHGNWTATGCKTSQSGDKFVECRCNHLTNFAILMQICTRTGGCDFDPIILDTVSTICVYISICCLFITVVTLAGLIVKKIRSSKERERESAVQYKFYIQLCIALLCMYIVFIVGIDQTEHYGGCVIVSVLIHYFTLVAVMWMTATCMFLFWIMVVNPFAKSKFNMWRVMLFVTVFCWIVPVIPVIIPVAIDRDLTLAYSDEEEPKIQFCFINDKYVFFIAFLAPLLILILMNLVMYISITFVQLRYICCARRERRAGNGSKKKNVLFNFTTALKLWCILSLFGLTWLFGAFTITQESAFIFSTLFAIFTSLQGFFIFVFLCILSRDALKCYKSVFCKQSEADQSSDLQSSATSHYSKSSSLSVSFSKQSGQSYYEAIASKATKSASTKEMSKKIKFQEHEPVLMKFSTVQV